MPLYDYRCAACGAIVEIRHGFHENHTGVCPKCGGALARVFNPAPILFKGSGFYVTDSRSKSSSEKSSSESNESKPASDSKSSESSSSGESAA
jgi:putative FmdB family regulatory protein